MRMLVSTGRTSALSAVSRRGWPGCRSPSATMKESKVKLPWSGYSKDQYHCRPTALMVMSASSTRSEKYSS
jgi:hypothetical protein